MKVSVLIVASPSAPLPAETLASLRCQAHAEWELITASAGDDAATAELMQEFSVIAGRPAHYQALPVGTTRAEVRNRLLELATGDPIAFLEPGDTWTPRHLSNALHELSSGADLAVSDLRVLDHEGVRVPNEFTVPAQLAANPTRALFTRDLLSSPSCVVFRREIAARAGAFDPRFRVAETRDFWLQCAVKDARFGLTRWATCQRRLFPPAEADIVAAAEETVLFHEKHRDLAAIPSALRRRLLAASLVSYGKMLRASAPGRAARYFWRAWSLQPVHVQTLGQFALTGWRSSPENDRAPPSSTALGSGSP